ncbi:MAG: cation diffusion facilitator family transporter [Bdellovibrionota bacterium]
MNDPYKKNVKKVLITALILNLAVATAKMIYGFLTGTLSMIGDGIHSTMDGCSSLMGIISVEYASRPSDDDHHYGHTKYETLAALGIATFIAIASWEITKRAIDRLLHPDPASFHMSGIWIILTTIVINFLLSRFEIKKGEEYNSPILKADGIHTSTDVWVSISVLASLFAIKYDLLIIDTIISFGIAIYFAFAAYQVLKENILVLTDAAFLDIKVIKDLALKENGVIGCHQVRTRGTPTNAYVDLHIQVAPEMTTIASHRLAHNIESRIQKEFPGIVEVLVHTEPYPDPDDED